MENEQSPQRERQPLDVFDPTGDGHEPRTLAEVVAAGQEMLDSVERFRAALYGCMTPLNFRTEERELKKLYDRAREILDPIGKAQDILEMDLPLATASALEAEYGDTWAPHGGHWGTLGPNDVLEVRLRARQVGPEELTTYRRELDKQPKIPSLIRRQRSRAKREAVTPEERAARLERIAEAKAAGMGRGAIRAMLARERAEAKNREITSELEAMLEWQEPDTTSGDARPPSD